MMITLYNDKKTLLLARTTKDGTSPPTLDDFKNLAFECRQPAALSLCNTYLQLSRSAPSTTESALRRLKHLNPVWNQELKLSVSKNYRALKVQLFDNDLISSDDPMSVAEVDLQPMITAVMAFGDPDLLANMQIGKWLRSNDNALTKDSIINIVSLKLQIAECGEIGLELEWISLTQ
ncbi:hypothetical protein ZIOFF_049369 [Zingiber officinale]|uniref:C2 domain-containing protein n=1 Tax=Zingiber officinale TaxID=94328 RepID=A0A8J5KV51_ZINOF|nr:hypothetical protein ZIOFF_049369 [Zingiber officinale]